jgi:hypothetical protein
MKKPSKPPLGVRECAERLVGEVQSSPFAVGRYEVGRGYARLQATERRPRLWQTTFGNLGERVTGPYLNQMASTISGALQ